MFKQMCHRYRLPILSGILIGTSYIPSYPISIFWSFVPLWLFWLKNFQPRTIFWSGWITQFLLTLIGFHWVAHTAHEFGHLPWALSIPVLIGYCSFANLHIVLAGLIWGAVHRRHPMKNFQSGLLLATLTICGEIFFPMIFPWNHGYVWLWANWEGFQFADVVGIQGLSAIGLFANVFFLVLWRGKEQQRRSKKIITVGSAVFLMVLLTFNFFGKLHGKKWNKTDSQTNILVVQANIGNLLKYIAEQGEKSATKTIAEKYFSLTRSAIDKQINDHPDNHVDFILWPETAYPEYLNPVYRRRLYQRKLKTFIRDLGIPLITGGYKNDIKNQQIYNGLFFVEPNGQIQSPPYTKSILLAFGEYFPGAETFPFLKKIVPAISDFSRGPGPTVWPFHGVKFGPQICYEGLYPEFSASLAQKGAQIFINVTNDSWFGDFFEAYQHLYMTLGRAVESRRPLVRSTNTGYSTAILASGKILEMSPIRSEWSNTFEIKYLKDPPLTLFTKYGDYIRHVFVGLLALILLWIICGKKPKATID